MEKIASVYRPGLSICSAQQSDVNSLRRSRDGSSSNISTPSKDAETTDHHLQ